MPTQNDAYGRFKDYDKIFVSLSSDILFPPEIYYEIDKYLVGTLLDIGTGDGAKLESILKRCKSNKLGKIIAIDPSPLVKRAQDRLKNFPNVEVKNISLEDFVSDLSFDVIFLFDVIEHTYRPNEVLSKISKMLKSNGTLIISTPNKPVYNFSEILFKHKLDPTHVNVMNFRKFKLLMQNYFYRIKFLGVLPLMKVGRRIPFFLKIHKYIAVPILFNNIICFARYPKKLL
ncbi:MAG: class I SAM-dependent methyltransferase [candidate division WOR-3 bacterium]